MPEDELKQRKPALDPNARVLLGRQLRDYYDRMRNTAVSDSLAQLLQQFEASTTQVNERQGSPQADPAPQNH
jgi:hypothetical protein